ncbi:MAG: TrmH family RNA methyltransferase [Deinococcus sp.]
MPGPLPISSLQNAQVKRLLRLKSRREREEEEVWLIEGARELSRARRGGVTLLTLYHCPELYSPEAAGLIPELDGLERVELSRAAFERVSHRQNPDGLLALARPPLGALPPQGPDSLLLVLVGLEKPGNLGALLRTADGVGVDGVLLAGEGTDPGNPGVIRASQGSVFTVPLLMLPQEEALAWLRGQGYTLVACTPEARQPYWDVSLLGRVALLLGSEHGGLPPGWREAADLRVSIPMRGEADSLNVSVAGALVLYEALRQRGGRERGGPGS